MTDPELIAWAIHEIRMLDELARSMVPEYAPLDSDDMEKMKGLKRLQERLIQETPVPS